MTPLPKTVQGLEEEDLLHWFLTWYITTHPKKRSCKCVEMVAGHVSGTLGVVRGLVPCLRSRWAGTSPAPSSCTILWSRAAHLVLALVCRQSQSALGPNRTITDRNASSFLLSVLNIIKGLILLWAACHKMLFYFILFSITSSFPCVMCPILP